MPGLYRVELLTWGFLLAVLLSFGLVGVVGMGLAGESLALSNTSECSLAPAVLMVACMLLCGLYFLDRFYYYKLLLGAVSRAAELERALGFQLTTRTVAFMPRQRATVLLSLFYGIPATGMLVLALGPMYWLVPWLSRLVQRSVHSLEHTAQGGAEKTRTGFLQTLMSGRLLGQMETAGALLCRRCDTHARRGGGLRRLQR